MMLIKPIRKILPIFLLNKLIVIHIFIVLSILNHVEVVLADTPEYQVKAAYLYQFTKFTEWPNTKFLTRDDPIRICILGGNPFGHLLDDIEKRKSQNRALVIEFHKSPFNISHCHVIYISRSEDKRLVRILQLAKNISILTVSDITDFAQRGGIIGLVVNESRVRLEINFNASSISGVKLSSKLLEVATLIKSR